LTVKEYKALLGNKAQVQRKPAALSPVPPAPNEALTGQKKQQARHRRKAAGLRREKKAVAELTATEQVYYHIHAGGSTLATVRIHHLSEQRLQRLLEVLETEFGAWPC
jgi:hypothetical protein